MRSNESDERITFNIRYRVALYLLMASVAFFLPLTAARVYETTYILSFTGVNNCLIRASLATTSVLLIILVSVIPVIRFKVLLPLSALVSIIFQLVIAFT